MFPAMIVRCDACGSENREQTPEDRCWQCDFGMMIIDLTLRCPTCGKRADVCFAHGEDWKKR